MWHKAKTLAGVLLALVVALPPALAAGDMPGADAAALWNYISKGLPYRQWAQWPDFGGQQPGRSPHGEFVQVWVNQPAQAGADLPLAAGALIVKEGYGADKALKSITVMYKVKGYNPAAGDWYWVAYSPQGQAKVAGAPKGCVGCHGGSSANDYVVAHQFR